MTREEVGKIRKEYKAGMRIVLEHMDDIQAPPKGTAGTIVGVDDMGSILMSWDNGSSLSIILEKDSFRVIQ